MTTRSQASPAAPNALRVGGGAEASHGVGVARRRRESAREARRDAASRVPRGARRRACVTAQKRRGTRAGIGGVVGGDEIARVGVARRHGRERSRGARRCPIHRVTVQARRRAGRSARQRRRTGPLVRAAVEAPTRRMTAPMNDDAACVSVPRASRPGGKIRWCTEVSTTTRWRASPCSRLKALLVSAGSAAASHGSKFTSPIQSRAELAGTVQGARLQGASAARRRLERDSSA